MKLNAVTCVILMSLMVRYSSQYIEMNIEDDDLCSLTNKKRKIKLDKGSRSALIIKQYRAAEHALDWALNLRCRFQVIPNSNREGVLAVIQHLIFRKNATTDECIDYVQFTRKDGSSSQKFCGRFNAALHMDHNFVDPSERVSSGTAFVDEKGELETTIFVSKERLKSDEEMDISIVYTAYKHCSQVMKKDPSYRPCSMERREFCIYSGFFYDSFINCPSPDCEDEEGCSGPEIIDGNKYGNKVLIGALSGVSIMFAIFILSLWICKTYKIFCWSQNFASPNTTTPHDQSADTPRVIELDEPASPSQSHTTSANRVDEDKDLPPSYDSLFPPR